MCSPSILCRQHLLGCHNEIHKLVGHLRKKKSITGWIQNNCLELRSIDSYHSKLVDEMRVRGYHHKSPLPSYSLDYLPENEREYKIDKEKALKDLLERCKKCGEPNTLYIQTINGCPTFDGKFITINKLHSKNPDSERRREKIKY